MATVMGVHGPASNSASMASIMSRPKSRSVDLLPLINSGAVDLLDHDRLVLQLTSLEKRTSRGGRDSIDHPPGGHDDYR
jgi:hypothetical protein